MATLTPVRIGPEHYEVDARGWICPLPKYVFDALRPRLEAGIAVDLLVDCPGAITDIPNDAAAHGFRARVAPIGDGEWKIDLFR